MPARVGLLTAALALGLCGMAETALAGPVYNGGPVISGTPDIYYIWYGNWSSGSKTLIQTFTKSLNGSSYLNTDSSMSGNGQVAYIKSTTVSASSHVKLYRGTSINGEDDTIENIVTGTLNKGLLPADPNGLYFVLTGQNITVSGFNTAFCGWHGSTNWGGLSLGVQYGFIGNPKTTDTGCYAQAVSPNNNFGVDAMVSVIAHELIEAVTDPTGTAWWDSNPASTTYGYENSDICAWNFGTTYKTGNGAKANIKLGTKNYLLQQQWVNTGAGNGFCAMSYSGPPITGLTEVSLGGPSGGVIPDERRPSVGVPEPASLAFLSAGFLGLGLYRRRRGK